MHQISIGLHLLSGRQSVSILSLWILYPKIAAGTMCESGWSSLNGKVLMKVSAVKRSFRRVLLCERHIFEPHSSGKSRSFGGVFSCQKAFCPVVSFGSGKQLLLFLFVNQSSTILMAIEDIFQWLSIN